MRDEVLKVFLHFNMIIVLSVRFFFLDSNGAEDYLKDVGDTRFILNTEQKKFPFAELP